MSVLEKIKTLFGSKKDVKKAIKKDARLHKAESQTALEEIELRDR